MQHFSENYWKKRFPAGKRANGPKKGERANGQTKSNARKRVRAKLQIRNRGPGIRATPLSRAQTSATWSCTPRAGPPMRWSGDFIGSKPGTATTRVERFDRRGTEPFEPFEPYEFFQNRNFPEFFLRKFKKIRKFQHDFLNYRRNSDKISSKSKQRSSKRIQK